MYNKIVHIIIVVIIFCNKTNCVCWTLLANVSRCNRLARNISESYALAYTFAKYCFGNNPDIAVCFFARDSEIHTRLGTLLGTYVARYSAAATLSEIGRLRGMGVVDREKETEKRRITTAKRRRSEEEVWIPIRRPLSLSFLPDSDRRWEPP